MRLKKFIAVTVLFGLFTPSIFPALAFDPNNLLSDYELTDSTSMSLAQIQRYLDRGYLGTYVTEDFEGKRKTAAEIIYQAATDYGISPKFIITLLQKEQSLIEDDDPSETQLNWATGYAVCDVCTTSTEAIQRWKGFGKQVNSATLQFSEGYLVDLADKGYTTANYGPGITTEIDGIEVTPENNATAALYSYTPHLHGNENFVKIWTSYFVKAYPSGSLLQAHGEDGVWLIDDGYRRPITSRAALVSRFNPDSVINVDQTILDQYDIGSEIAFPNYSLLWSEESGAIYLIVDDEKRWVESMEAFRAIGFHEEELISVEQSDLDNYIDGEPITVDSADPYGHLYQNKLTGGVYFVEDGIKHPLYSRAILESRYKNWLIVPTEPEELDEYETGDPVLLPDGLLVKETDSPTVYVISQGELRPITSGDVFESMNWKWENVVSVDKKTLELHSLGDAIETEIISDSDTEVEISNNY